jgi:hypothetical protein
VTGIFLTALAVILSILYLFLTNLFSKSSPPWSYLIALTGNLIVLTGIIIAFSIILGVILDIIGGYFLCPTKGLIGAVNCVITLAPAAILSFLSASVINDLIFFNIETLNANQVTFVLTVFIVVFLGFIRNSSVLVSCFTLLGFLSALTTSIEILNSPTGENISSFLRRYPNEFPTDSVIFISIAIIFYILFTILLFAFTAWILRGFLDFRLPFWMIFNLMSFLARENPIFWDEITVLPFHGWRKSLDKLWERGDEQALDSLSHILTSRLRLNYIHDSLYRHLHKSPLPIHFLYLIFCSSATSAYARPPVTTSEWNSVPSIREVFVYSIATKRFVEDAWIRKNKNYFLLLDFSRFYKDTSLTKFASFLYSLAYLEEYLGDVQDYLKQNRIRYKGLEIYPGGIEIINSLDCIAQYLDYTSLDSLSHALSCLEGLPSLESAIRPPVIHALQQFGHIAQDVAIFQVATSRVNQLAALGRATDALEDLREYINETVLPPEKVLLQDIVRRWRSLVSEAIGKLGKVAIAEPVPNPYVAGNPVAGDLFVGAKKFCGNWKNCG